jgi:hypothetical protein
MGRLEGGVNATVCGRTRGEADPSALGTSGVSWTRPGCLLPMAGDREILLLVGVAVPEHTSPIWEIHADLGS